MSCSYTKATQYLIVSSPVSVTVVSGSTLIFKVDNWLNPYNGKPKSGYTIVTTDLNGGIIDSSIVGGLNITLTVDTWAVMDLAVMTRIDVMSTIRQPSSGQMNIGVAIPIDAYCRIEIQFPVDMPLTSDLTLVSSNGIINTAKKAPDNIDLASRSFYLDGCSQYYSSVNNSLQIFQMRNKENVRIT